MSEIRVEHSDFIAVYNNLIPAEVCKTIVKEFERFKALGTVHAGATSGGVNKSVKNSLDADFMASAASATYLAEEVFPLMQEAYQEYMDQYPILANSMDGHEMTGFQVQKYEDRGSGYHAFHVEAGSKATSNRVVTWLLYLTDIEKGGETEFLNQRLRLKPSVGTLVYFPTGYTHPHRGNPALGTELKYVATGWLTFT